MSKSKLLYSQKGFAKFRKRFGDSIRGILVSTGPSISNARISRSLRNA